MNKRKIQNNNSKDLQRDFKQRPLTTEELANAFLKNLNKNSTNG